MRTVASVVTSVVALGAFLSLSEKQEVSGCLRREPSSPTFKWLSCFKGYSHLLATVTGF